MVSAKNALDIHLSFETFLCHRKYFKTAKIVLILKIYKFCGAIVQSSRPVTFYSADRYSNHYYQKQIKYIEPYLTQFKRFVAISDR